MLLQGPSIRADIGILPCRAISAAAWQHRVIQSVLNKCACRLRPEGPLMNSPGRQAGVKDMTKLSAEGAAREAPMVSRLQRSIAS
jgi:hypothetical protein